MLTEYPLFLLTTSAWASGLASQRAVATAARTRGSSPTLLPRLPAPAVGRACSHRPRHSRNGRRPVARDPTRPRARRTRWPDSRHQERRPPARSPRLGRRIFRPHGRRERDPPRYAYPSGWELSTARCSPARASALRSSSPTATPTKPADPKEAGHPPTPRPTSSDRNTRPLAPPVTSRRRVSGFIESGLPEACSSPTRSLSPAVRASGSPPAAWLLWTRSRIPSRRVARSRFGPNTAHANRERPSCRSRCAVCVSALVNHVARSVLHSDHGSVAPRAPRRRLCGGPRRGTSR